MSRMGNSLLMGTLLLAATACNDGHLSDRAQVRDLSFDRNAKNVALLVGAPTNLKGIDLDLNLVERMLTDANSAQGFKINRAWKPSSQTLVEATREAAASVGEDGTLVWYFSGHGAKSGALLAETGGTVNFDLIAEAMREARTTPLKRLVIFIDACYSGQIVDGTMAVGRDADQSNDRTLLSLAAEAAESEEAVALKQLGDNLTQNVTASLAVANGAVKEGSEFKQYAAARLSEQLLVVAAARKTETSLATRSGSTFTTSVASVYSRLKGRSDATIKDFLEGVRSKTIEVSSGHHTPVYRAVPAEFVLSDKLVGASQPSASGADTPPADDVSSPPLFGEDLFLALGPGAVGAEGLTVYAASSQEVQKVFLCAGSKAACTASVPSKGELLASNASRLDSRRVFASASPMLFEGGRVYTVVGLDGRNKITNAQSFELQAK